MRELSLTEQRMIGLLEHIDALLRLLLVLRDNPTDLIVQKKLIDTAGNAEQLPYLSIDYGCSVLITALASNGGTIYVASSKVEAEDSDTSVPLAAGSSLEVRMKNLARIWINSSVDGEGVTWSVEGRR